MLNLLFVLFFFGLGRPAKAPAVPASAVVVSSGEMKAAMKNAKPTPGAIPGTFDLTMRSVDAGNSNVGVALVRRLTPETHDAILHEKVTEIYYITEGSGMLETGGTLTDPKPFGTATGLPEIGPSQRGTGIQGGTSRHVGAGDVVVIPAGMPHRFTSIDGPVSYIDFRVDPGKVTPLK
jgi:mannose-6-phosphate isomerase-like protein (cupin superfamily)